MTGSPRSRATQADLFPSPKRGDNERSGIHAWFPYYAGFSATFVNSTLDSLALPKDAIVLDPMNGSGTTTLVAQQRGFLAAGNELNPAMAILARAKDAALKGRKVGLDSALREVRAVFRKKKIAADVGEYAKQWLAPTTFSAMKRIEAGIEALGGGDILSHRRLSNALRTNETVESGGTASLLRAALLVALRRRVNLKGSKNPTWFKPAYQQDASEAELWEEFVKTAYELQADIDQAFEEPSASSRLLVIHGDARDLALRDSSVDAIITSPPYLTRIDYAVSTAPELVFLGYHSESAFHEIRSMIMGSTCIVPGEHEARAEWGPTCNELLTRIREHSSKASKTYYYKTHIQYFRDAEVLLRECLRVLRPGGSAFLVVQDSWYKDIHVPLDRIYSEMACEIGAMSATVVNRVAVKTHLGLVNTRARRYAKGELAEHVVRISKPE